MLNVSRHRRMAVAALALGGAVLVPALPASAARSTGGTTPSGGSCSATPNPVAVWATYTVNGAGLPAGSIVNVYVRDAGGSTHWTSAQVDSTGHAVVTGSSAYAGTASVTIRSSGRKTAQLAACSFQVV